MRLADFLAAEHILVPLHAETVREAVTALVKHLADKGIVAAPEQLDRLVADERIRDLIHVGHRVLLPHMRTTAVEKIVVALGISPAPLRYASAAAEGAEQVVVLILAPPESANTYLQLVAALTRGLRNDSVVDQLVAARSPEEVLRIPEISELVLPRRFTVRDLMTQRVYRVRPDTPVQELMELMQRHTLNAVPVVGEKREVLGMVTDRDLLRHLLPGIPRTGEDAQDSETARQASRQTPVREIMSRSVMCISEDQGLAEVASIMINKDVERLPVVSEGRLTGFLTRSDIVRKLFGS